MTLRDTLRTCVRAWKATVSDITRLLAHDARERASDAAPAAPTTDPEPLAYRYRSIEALLFSPTVDADRSGYVFPMDGGIEGGAAWLALAYPHPWSYCTRGYRELQVGIWLGCREDVRQGAWA